MKVIC